MPHKIIPFYLKLILKIRVPFGEHREPPGEISGQADFPGLSVPVLPHIHIKVWNRLVLAVKHQHDIRILFDATGITEIHQVRWTVVGVRHPVELAEQHHRNPAVHSQKFEPPGPFRYCLVHGPCVFRPGYDVQMVDECNGTPPPLML